MDRAKKISCLLLSLVLGMMVLLCVSPAMARYVHQAEWEGTYISTAAAVDSDCLSAEGSHVDLGTYVYDNMSGEQIIPIKLWAAGQSVTGALRCEVLQGGEYITAAMSSETVEVATETEQGIELILQKREGAVLTQATKVVVKVSFIYVRRTMAAQFYLTLQPTDEGTSEGTVAPENTEGGLQELFDESTCRYLTKDLVLVQMQVPENCRTITLQTEEGGFPLRTRYQSSVTEGEWVLYRGRTVILPVTGQQTLAVLLDLSRTEQADTLSITATTDTGGSDSIVLTQVSTEEPVTLCGTAETSPKLSRNGKISFTIAESLGLRDPDWTTNGSGTNLIYSIQRRTTDGWEEMAADRGISVTAIPTQLNNAGEKVADGQIILAIGEEQISAGEYRLTITLQWDGLRIARVYQPFFVDYR